MTAADHSPTAFRAALRRMFSLALEQLTADGIVTLPPAELAGLAGVRVARKHLGWYLAAAGHTGPDGEAFRRRWVTLATPQEQAHEVAAFFAG